MRSRLSAVFTAFAILAFAPALAGADDVQQQLQQMQNRMNQLEDRLQATTDQLEVSNQRVSEQQTLIERSGLAHGSGASSGLASFLDTLEIGGWVTASYWYNVNDPDNDDLFGPNTGAFGHANFFNPDANTFALDQLWFALEKPVDESSRAGFGADILFGKTAGLLSNSVRGTVASSFNDDCRDHLDFTFGLVSDRDCIAGDATDLYVHQAYVQYLAPLGNGVKVKAGKFMTLIGYETIHAPENMNISRGIVWQNLQPIDHVGVLASTERGGWDAAVGLVNGFSPLDPDTNDGKSVTGRVGYAGENFSVALSGIHGAESAGNERTKTSVGDLIITIDPTERLTLFANGTFLRGEEQDTNGHDLHAWGAAVGGRIALTDRTGFSVRGEYLEDDGALITGGSVGVNPINVTLWSATGTLDHKLTENLLLRGEVRWDRGRLDQVVDNIFADDSGSSSSFDENDQLLVGVDISYLFN